MAGYPLTNSLAGTENLLGWQVFYTPLRASGVETVAAMNTLVCLSFVIAATGGAAFARYIGLEKRSALCAGFIFAFAPIHLYNTIQFQSLAVCWLPWALLFIDRFVSRGGLSNAIGAILLSCLTMLSGMYIGIFLVITAFLWVVAGHVVNLRPISWHSAGRVLVLAILCAALLSPILIRYVQFHREHGLVQSITAMSRGSASALIFFEPSSMSFVWSKLPSKSGGAFPGVLISALLALGIWKAPLGRKCKGRLLLVGMVLLILAFGPYLKLGETPVHLGGHPVVMPGILLGLLPGVRVPWRLLLPAILFFSLVCGTGVTALLSRFGTKAFGIAVVGLLLELYPAPSLARRAVELPPPLSIAQAYQHLSACPVSVELPVPEPTAGAHEVLSRYVYGASGHLHRVVSYYASIWPPEVWSLQREAARLPDERSRESLVRAGINCVILHKTPQYDYEGRLASFRQAGYSVAFSDSESAIAVFNVALK
jgi:hypothetical protein